MTKVFFVQHTGLKNGFFPHRAKYCPRPAPFLRIIVFCLCLLCGFSVFAPAPAHAGNSAPETEKGKSLPSLPFLRIKTVHTPFVSPTQDAGITATFVNGGKTDLKIISAEIRESKNTLTNHTLLYRWMEGSAAGKPVQMRELSPARTVSPGEGEDIVFTLRPEERKWPTGAFTWGAQGVELCVSASAPDSASQSGSFPGSAAAGKNADGQRYCARTAVVGTSHAQTTKTPVTALVPLSPGKNMPRAARPSFKDELFNRRENGNSHNADKKRVPGASAPEKAREKQISDFTSRDRRGITFLPEAGVYSDRETNTALRSLSAAQTLPLPFANPDFAALAHGKKEETAAQILRLSEQIYASAQGSQPSSGGAGTAGQPPRNVFSAARMNNLPDRETFRLLQNLGIKELLVPQSEFLSRRPAFYTPGAVKDIRSGKETMRVIGINTPVSMSLAGFLRLGTEAPIKLDTPGCLQTAVALTAIHHTQAPNFPRPLVIDAGSASSEILSRLLDCPWLETSDLKQISQSAAPQNDALPVPEEDTSPGEITASEINSLFGSQMSLLPLVHTFADGAKLEQRLNSSVYSFFSLDLRKNPSRRKKQIAAFAAENRHLPSFSFEHTSTINLISQQANIPIRVKNPYPYPARVTVRAYAPEKRILKVKPTAVTLKADGVTNVYLPLTARGSGNTGLQVEITDAQNIPLGENLKVFVRVRANWENIGTLILSLLFLAVLVFGTVKSIRRGRRSRPLGKNNFPKP